jgi:ABC-type iron transport system FetAB ATPase subunit
MARLAIESLCTFGFGPFDLSIDAGACAAIAGPSGSGKSLMLRAVADLDPHQGRVLLDGTPCDRMPPSKWRSLVRLVPAESAWWTTLVGEHFRGIPYGLERLGFDRGVLDLPVARMSTGERQRLALLRALEDRPPVLLLDEPTANLDAENSANVEAILLEHMREHDAALIWITHDASQADRIADRQWMIADRRLVARNAA